MKILVGYTGLVGKTLLNTIKFDHVFNSKNINNYNELVNDGNELYLSCLPATKWLVNKNLYEDIENIHNIISIIRQKHYSKVILISTIDVYNTTPLGSNEEILPQINKINYGTNRRLFELFVSEYLKTDELKIFRLPALFNQHIKKNILYDLINNNNISKININSSFQWYNLDRLPTDIEYYSNSYPDEIIFNLFTEPISTYDIIKLFPQYKEEDMSYNKLINYDYKTKFTDSGYIRNKIEILEEIKTFINGFSCE